MDRRGAPPPNLPPRQGRGTVHATTADVEKRACKTGRVADGWVPNVPRIGDEVQNRRNGASQESRDRPGPRPVEGDRVRCSHSIFSRFRMNRPAITTMNPTAERGGIERLTWTCSGRVRLGSVGPPFAERIGGNQGPSRVNDRVWTGSASPARSVAKYSS